MRRTDPCASFYSKNSQTQAGSNISKQLCQGQDTRVFQEHVWIIDRRTISKGLDNRGNSSTRAIVRNRGTQSPKGKPIGQSKNIKAIIKTQVNRLGKTKTMKLGMAP